MVFCWVLSPGLWLVAQDALGWGWFTGRLLSDSCVIMMLFELREMEGG